MQVISTNQPESMIWVVCTCNVSFRVLFNQPVEQISHRNQWNINMLENHGINIHVNLRVIEFGYEAEEGRDIISRNPLRVTVYHSEIILHRF